ncbi:AzlD domain-containing protein [Bacillus litorisediminis]|uniref:AzlD domain-containing protein n=1 Tax=Bacillus litorisediminis TaxID=2922713 RepID=UPI001FAE27A7|nr:AzlD domain-containing protein [Bacillus litorisediminis]
MINNWILIGLLTISTYISRIIGIKMMAGREMSSTMRLYFHYVPVGIMSALIIKQILVPSNGQISISFPIIIGCLAAAISIKRIKSFLPAVLIGVIFGWLTRIFF